MRVQMNVGEEAASRALSFPPNSDYVDLRNDPHGVQQIPAARENPPLRNFLEALNGGQAIFATFAASVREGTGEKSNDAEDSFGSRVALIFADADLNSQRDLYEQLAVQLAGLLLRESGDAILCELEVARCAFAGGVGQCLRIKLTARAASQDQARLRWGLAMARLQQALLYCSRQIRQKMSPTGTPAETTSN